MAIATEMLKAKLVRHLRVNPGAENIELAALVGLTTSAVRHHLGMLASGDSPYVRLENVANGSRGGIKATWYHVRDYVPRTAMDTYETKDHVSAGAAAVDGVPAIYLLYKPSLPDLTNARSMHVNDSMANVPQRNPDQTSRGGLSPWSRSDAAVISLCL